MRRVPHVTSLRAGGNQRNEPKTSGRCETAAPGRGTVCGARLAARPLQRRHFCAVSRCHGTERQWLRGRCRGRGATRRLPRDRGSRWKITSLTSSQPTLPAASRRFRLPGESQAVLLRKTRREAASRASSVPRVLPPAGPCCSGSWTLAARGGASQPAHSSLAGKLADSQSLRWETTEGARGAALVPPPPPAALGVPRALTSAPGGRAGVGEKSRTQGGRFGSRCSSEP